MSKIWLIQLLLQLLQHTELLIGLKISVGFNQQLTFVTGKEAGGTRLRSSTLLWETTEEDQEVEAISNVCCC